MGRMTKPCPGCKVVHEYRTSTDVCHDCSQLLLDGKLLRKEREELAKKKENVLVLVPQQPHWLPHVYDNGNVVQKAFHELGQAVGVPITEKDYENSINGFAGARGPHVTRDDAKLLVGEAAAGHYGSSDDVYAFTKRAHAAIVALWQAVKEWGDSRNAQGRKEGSNLLVGLATGEYSVKDFNKHTRDAEKPEKGARR